MKFGMLHDSRKHQPNVAIFLINKLSRIMVAAGTYVRCSLVATDGRPVVVSVSVKRGLKGYFTLKI